MSESKNKAAANDLEPADAQLLIKAIEDVEKEEVQDAIQTRQNEVPRSGSCQETTE
jgi:ribosomal protein L12E/L44/L45/RPP1/RPP2